MARGLLRALVLLAAGAAITVAVSWWCACRVGLRVLDSTRPHDRAWQDVVPGGWPAAPADRWTITRPALRFEFADVLVHDFETDVAAPGHYTQVRFEAGWPLRAMSWTIERVSPTPYTGSVYIVKGAENSWRSGLKPPESWPVVDPFDSIRRLPVRPIGWYFLLNALLYGAVVWVIAIGTRSLARRWVERRRRRIGRCQTCGYDLRGASHARCPECGVPCVVATPRGAAIQQPIEHTTGQFDRIR